MAWLYLASLLVSIAGLAVLDCRFKLAFWRQPTRTALTLASAIGVFIVWDLLGIWLGIFFHGGSPYTLTWRLLPEFPPEEVFFLFLLSYVTLLLYLGGKKRWPRT